MGKKILAMLLAGLMVLETGTMQVAATENQTVFEHSSTEEGVYEERLEPQRTEGNASEESLEPREAGENENEEVLEPQRTEGNASEESLEPREAEGNASEESLEPQGVEAGESQAAEPIDQAAVSPGEGLESQIKPGKVWKELDCDYHRFGNQVEESLKHKTYDVYVVDVEQQQKISFSAQFTFDGGGFGKKETTVEAAIYRLQHTKNKYTGDEKYKVEKKVWKSQVRVGKEEVLLEEEITLPKGYYGIVIENMKNETYLKYSFETAELSLGKTQVHIGDFWDKDDFGGSRYYDYFIGDKVEPILYDKTFDAYVVKFSREKKISLSLNFALTKLPSRLKNATINVAVYQLYEDEDDGEDEGYYYRVEKKLWEKRIEVPKEGGNLEEEITLLKGCYGIVIENLQGGAFVSYNFSTKDISIYAKQISIPKELFLEYGEKKVIPVTNIKPEGTVKGINWSSSNKKVATVDSAGKVTAKWGGTCKITATLVNGKKYSCKVYVEDLTLSKIELRIAKREKYTLQALYAYHPVTWKSKNPKIAKVDKNGTVTGKKKGTTYIWAYMGKQKVKCKVIVEEPKLSKKTLKIGTGGSTELSLKGTKRKTKWSTSSKRIVTVKNGKITAKKKGKAKITASIGNIKYTCRITVGDCPLKSTSLKVAVKGRRNIETRKKEKKIKWSSSAPKIASVKNGVVVGKKKGQAVVKVKIGDVTYNCKVKVENPKINQRSIMLEHNGSYTLKFSGTTMKAKWSSSNSSIATVNAAGKVSGVNRGNTVITADIGGKKITCKVQVRGEQPNFSVSLIDEVKYYYIAGMIKVNNNGSQPMRICKENFVLNNGSYSFFNRNLTLVSLSDVLAEESKITPIPYVDIAPGQSEWIAFIVEGPSSYYVSSSIFQFEIIYDGERYRVSVGWQHGLTFYRY